MAPEKTGKRNINNSNKRRLAVDFIIFSVLSMSA